MKRRLIIFFEVANETGEFDGGMKITVSAEGLYYRNNLLLDEHICACGLTLSSVKHVRLCRCREMKSAARLYMKYLEEEYYRDLDATVKPPSPGLCFLNISFS